MSKHRFDTLSAEQRENVRSALVAAFGSDSVGTVTPIAGGASTVSTFRLEVRGRRYLLRVEGEPSPLRNPHQYVSMRIAAEAGIAPDIHYIDEAARIAVLDFVEQQPLKTYPGGPRALAQALGELFSRVFRGGFAGDAGYRSFGSNPAAVPARDSRRATHARRARDQAHPGQDVPCVVFLRRQTPRIRRRRLASLKPWQDG
jgi:hypothetical protein